MSIETLIYIIIAGIIGLALALFQYFYKKKSISKLDMLFSFLRFITVFSILLLLINPKFEKTTFFIEKPQLVIAIDNSNSIKHLQQDAKAKTVIETISQDKELNNKFNLSLFTFGENFKILDSITFDENQTNINNAFQELSQIYKESNAPTILISDGNQTFGSDYEFIYKTYTQPIYPIILGDTITYNDLKIEQLNVNKYAFFKNKFPVEAILVYNGHDSINSRFNITKGSQVVYSANVSFTQTNNSKIINFTLPADEVGTNTYKITLDPIDNEKNTINNYKNFAVEVIDEKTKIAIVSNFPHPDLGALKKSIESNEQRSVTILNTNEILSQIDDFKLVIIYQPNNNFKNFFNILNAQNKNRFIIVGPKTELNFLNATNNNYSIELTNQTEEYQAELNLNYTPFAIEDIDYNSFPPLFSNYGSISFTVPFETILNKTINGISINEPLLATFEAQGRREGVLFGENIWQWRAQSFTNSKTFVAFDNFMGKLIQYLASNQLRKRLNVEFESFYYGNNDVLIRAQVFDKNYNFNPREALTITVVDKNTQEEKVFPLVLKNNYYQIDLNSLPASEYSFTIRASNENLSQTGNFQILEYNIEQQFLNANVTKLQRLATNSQGSSFFINDTESLIPNLLNDNRYVPVQKSHKIIVPLIDWKYLLMIIILSLSIEWFLRKYNGLI